jgi:hypothetical protein
MEIVKQENMLPEELSGAWGSENITNEDILIPKILLMQAMSDMVADKEIAEAGDIVKSTTEEVLASRDEHLDFVPLMSFNTWIVSEQVGQKFEFRYSEPYTIANAKHSLEWTENGQSFRRDKAMNFYVLVKKDLEAAAKGDGACIPCLLQFKRTSTTAGKKLAGGISESAMLKRPACSRVYKLSSFKRKTDDHTYYVLDVVPNNASKVSDEEIRIAKQWYDTLKTSTVRVDETVED